MSEHNTLPVQCAIAPVAVGQLAVLHERYAASFVTDEGQVHLDRDKYREFVESLPQHLEVGDCEIDGHNLATGLFDEWGRGLGELDSPFDLDFVHLAAEHILGEYIRIKRNFDKNCTPKDAAIVGLSNALKEYCKDE